MAQELRELTTLERVTLFVCAMHKADAEVLLEGLAPGPRHVLEKVADGVQAERAGALGRLLVQLQRLLQARGPRRADGRLQQRCAVQLFGCGECAHQADDARRCGQ